MRGREWTLAAGAIGVILALLFTFEPWADAPGADDPGAGPAPPGLLDTGERHEEGDAPTLEGAIRIEPTAPGEEPLPAPVDLKRVDRRRDLHGIVVRADDSPVAGARLEVLYYPWSYGRLLTDGQHEVSKPGPTSRSARDGTFALRLRRGDHVHLRVTAEGLAPNEFTMRQAGEFMRVVMREPVTLAVTVRAPSGEPAAGLDVHVFRGGRDGSMLERNGRTDEEGRCTFDDLPPGGGAYLELQPRREGWGDPSWIRLQLPDAGTLTKEVDLPEGRTLRGLVTDETTGAPIEGARVGANWVLDRETRTDADGRYVLHGWSGQGVRDVHVLAQGYGRAQALVGEKEVLDFELRPGSSVRGRVLDRERRPIEGAQVMAVGSEQEGTEQSISMAHAWTDAEGRFVLSSLRRDMDHVLTVIARGHAQHHLDVPAEAAKDEIDLGDLVMGAPRTLAGVVRSADGEPDARVRVSLQIDEPGKTGYRYGRAWERTTDDLGRFRFEDLPPGAYTVSTRPGSGPGLSRRVQVVDRDEPTTVTLTSSKTREVVVRVVDDQGTPQPSVYVHATGGGIRRIQAQTDAHGVATLQLPLVEARLTVALMDERGFATPAPVEVAVDQAEAEIVLSPAAFTRGTLLDASGKPLPWARINVEQDGKPLARNLTVTKADGTFEVRTNVGVVLDLVFTGQAGPSEKKRYEFQNLPLEARRDGVRAGSTGVVLRCEAIATDRSLTIRVVGPDGVPVEGANVWVMPRPASMKDTYAVTDAEGRVHVEQMMASEVQVGVMVTATAERPWRQPGVRKVVPENQELTIKMRRAVTISGRLLKQDGSPGVGAVFAMVGGKSIGAVTSDPEGNYVLVLRAEPAGPITLESRAVAPDGEALLAKIEDVRPGATNVVLQLEPAK